MPEGDTIHRTAATLRRVLVDRPLTRVEIPRVPPPLPRPGDRVTRVEARGKHLLIHTDGGLVVHTHQRMSGTWHVQPPGRPWRRSPQAARVVLAVEDVVAVCFAAPVVEVLDVPALRRHPALRRLGPDLCDPRADLDDAAERLSRLSAPDRPIGDALLDQRAACGIGNVYRCEVLFLHGLHPATAVAALDHDCRRALLATAAELLRANLDTTVRTTVPGGSTGALWVYGRAGRPCRRCGTAIVRQRLGEHARMVDRCPTCQPAAGADADGRDADGRDGDRAPAR